jgi:hypothetical protein
MQKIADAADEFMEQVAVPKVNNSEIAKLVRTKYTTLDLKVLGDFLDKANVLKFEALATGLFSAAGLSGEMARESGYGNVWVRDNVFVAHALVLAGREPRAVQFSILGGEFDDGGEVERGAVAGILDVVGA